jgi:membrane protein YqaA with SNARE-associated domain
MTADALGPLLTLFATSFAAATLVPLPSEAALFAYVHVYPERTALAVAVATLGNTAGGMTSYGIGRLAPQTRVQWKAVDMLKRYGAPLTLLAWLPLVGDALCVAAGWLRMHWAAVLGFMAAGRFARYVVVAALSS